MDTSRKIQTYIDGQGEHRWRMRSVNGRILADSGQGYRTERARDQGIELTFDGELYEQPSGERHLMFPSQHKEPIIVVRVKSSAR